MSLNIVVGLSGVGKSTVLEEAMLLSKKDYKLVNYGDKMMEIAEDYGIESRDKMKQLDIETYKEIQREAAEKIFELADGHEVILDTHTTIKTPHGYIPGLPRWSIEEMDPKRIIMITASAEQIWKRVKDDNEREREHGSLDGVKEYLRISEEMASTCTVLTGAYLKKIENPDGRAEEAAEELVNCLES